MSWLDSIASGIKSVSSSFLSSLNPQTSGLANVAKVEAKVVQNIGSTLTLGLIPGAGPISSTNAFAGAIANNPITSVTLIATPLSFATGGSSVVIGAGNLIKSAYIAAPKTTVASVLLAPVAVGAISKAPVQTATALINAPNALANIGSNISSFAVNPSIANAKTIFSENPVATSALAAIGIGAVGIGTTSLISNALNTAALKDNTKATLMGGNSPVTGKEIGDMQSPSDNGHSEDIAKVNAKSATDIAKIQADASNYQAKLSADTAEKTLKAQTNALQMQISAQQEAAKSQTLPTAKTTTKKKAKKKKRKIKKKAKKKKR